MPFGEIYLLGSQSQPIQTDSLPGIKKPSFKRKIGMASSLILHRFGWLVWWRGLSLSGRAWTSEILSIYDLSGQPDRGALYVDAGQILMHSDYHHLLPSSHPHRPPFVY